MGRRNGAKCSYGCIRMRPRIDVQTGQRTVKNEHTAVPQTFIEFGIARLYHPARVFEGELLPLPLLVPLALVESFGNNDWSTSCSDSLIQSPECPLCNATAVTLTKGIRGLGVLSGEDPSSNTRVAAPECRVQAEG